MRLPCPGKVKKLSQINRRASRPPQNPCNPRSKSPTGADYRCKGIKQDALKGHWNKAMGFNPWENDPTTQAP